jgi:hypothetical protein
MSVQQIEAYGTKKYYDELISNLLAQSKKLTPVAKCLRILPFIFVGYSATSTINLTVPFEVKTVKCTIVGISDNGHLSHDIYTLKCSIYDGREIGVFSNASHENSSIYPAFEYIYQQPRSFQNEIVSMQAFTNVFDPDGNPINVPVDAYASITLILELSSM